MINGYLSAAFDLLNVGDLDVIAEARRRCDYLVIGVYSDDDVARANGRPPVVPLTERLELVRHVRGVDHVITHGDIDPEDLRSSHTVFAVGDAPVRRSAPDGSWIEPGRRTRSQELRAALLPAFALPVDADRSGVA